MWYPIANLSANFDYSSTDHSRHGNSHLHNKFGKSDDWRLRFDDFQTTIAMLSIKNCCFTHVTWVCMRFYIWWPKFTQIGQNCAEILQKKIFNMTTDHLSWIYKMSILSLNDHPRNRKSHLPTKFDQSRMIRGWNTEIKLFSKWRQSIFNFRQLQLWSCHVCFHDI